MNLVPIALFEEKQAPPRDQTSPSSHIYNSLFCSEVRGSTPPFKNVLEVHSSFLTPVKSFLKFLPMS